MYMYMNMLNFSGPVHGYVLHFGVEQVFFKISISNNSFP